MATTARMTRATPTATGGTLTVAQGAALSVGAVLGTGVITLPALAAEVAGPASLLAWAALVLLSVPLASTFAALGARHPDGGGVSTYSRYSRVKAPMTEIFAAGTPYFTMRSFTA